MLVFGVNIGRLCQNRCRRSQREAAGIRRRGIARARVPLRAVDKSARSRRAAGACKPYLWRRSAQGSVTARWPPDLLRCFCRRVHFETTAWATPSTDVAEFRCAGRSLGLYDGAGPVRWRVGATVGIQGCRASLFQPHHLEDRSAAALLGPAFPPEGQPVFMHVRDSLLFWDPEVWRRTAASGTDRIQPCLWCSCRRHDAQ